MSSPRFRRVLLVSTLTLGVSQLAVSAARADIPAGYTGTPYGGAAKAIPGRVNLVDCDLGGEGVAYHADHRRSNSAGYEPISGNDYRPGDKDLPNICKTNEANKDYMVGTNAPYPATTPTKEEYYIGYAHAVDWVKVTVDVKVAGTYNVSSTWASEGGTWGLSIWFNDGKGTPDAQRPKDGVNKSGIVEMPGTSDYHKWKEYPNFTKVTLSAGLQVMTFHLEKHDHLQYGYLQFDLEGGNPTTGTAGTGGGTAGTGGGTTGGAGTGATNTGASGTGGGAAGTGAVTTGTAGTGAVTTGAAGTGAATTGTAGTGASTTGAAGTGTGAAGTSGGRDSGGGCAISGAARRPEAAIAGVLLFALVALRRRRRS